MKAHKIIGSKQNPSRSKYHQPTGKLKLVSKSSAAACAALDVYLQSLAPSGRKSMRSLLSTVGKIIQAQQSSAVIWHKITYQQIQHVRATLIERHSVNTVNLALAGVRGVAKAAFNLGLMQSEAMLRIKAVAKAKGEVLEKGRTITTQEITAMVAQCSKRGAGVRGVRDKALLLVGCYTGVRCNELINLSVMDFNQSSGVLRILHGKGNKQREIYLSSNVMSVLNEWIKFLPEGDEGLLFRRISKGGKIGSGGLSNWGIAVILRELQEKSGVQRFTVHDTRRTFISTLLEKNVDINTIRKLAGHSDITVTARYDRRSDKQLINASRNISGSQRAETHAVSVVQKR